MLTYISPNAGLPQGNKKTARTRLAAAAMAAAALATTSGAVAITSTVAAAATTSGPTLVIYSAQGYDSAETTAFQEATGIHVSLDDDSTGPLLIKVEAEKNNPKWGLLWVDGATAFASLDQQGLLMKGWEPTVSWNSLGNKPCPPTRATSPRA
jgi:iron(III) transport system substrate-binding protein